MMKKKLLAMVLSLAALTSAVPTQVMAEQREVDPKTQNNYSVMASAEVTDDELDALGLDVIVSIPTSISLTMDSQKRFVGSEKIYAYGVLLSGGMISVSIDSSSSDYKKLSYSQNGETTSSLHSADNYSASVVETLSKKYFYASETKANFIAHKNDEVMPNYSQLDVTISNLIPSEGTGFYFTRVPLKIEFA